jgi:hypothetical protein
LSKPQILLGSLVMVVILLLATASASAKPATLTLTKDDGEASTPSELVLAGEPFSIESGYFNPFRLIVDGGEVVCGNPRLTGTFISNGEKKDLLEIEKAANTLNFEKDNPCTYVPTGAGGEYVEVNATGLPWSLSVSAKGKAELKAAKRMKVGFRVEFNADEVCHFEAAKVKGTNAATATPGRLRPEFRDAPFTLRASTSSGPCPREASLELEETFVESGNYDIFEQTVR